MKIRKLKALRRKVNQPQFILYILSASKGKKRSLEGPTHVDAILVNSNNGFGIFFEAKVLSDISYQITYDTTRNQITRNIDVMLEKNKNLFTPLNKRDPEKSLFILLTPEKLKNPPPSRLYLEITIVKEEAEKHLPFLSFLW